MRWQDQTLHIRQYVILKALIRLVSVLKVVEKERELVLIVTNQVKNEAFLQSRAKFSEKAIFLPQ